MTSKTTSTRRGSIGIERESTPKRVGWYSALLWLGIGWCLVGVFGVVAPSAPFLVLGLGIISVLISLASRFLSASPQGASAVPRAIQKGSSVAVSKGIRSAPSAKVTSVEPTVPLASVEGIEPSKRGTSTVLPSHRTEFEEKTATLVEAIQSAISTAKDREVKPRTELNDVMSRLVTLEQMARRLEMVALNAAIEAARAKEHGSGFSIVAKEVRVIAEKLRAQIAASITLVRTPQSEETVGGWATRTLSATLDGLNGLKADFEKDGIVRREGPSSTQDTVVKRPTPMKERGLAVPIRRAETNERASVTPGRLYRIGGSGSKDQPKRGVEKSKAPFGERILLESKHASSGAKTVRPRTPRPMPLVRSTASKERAVKPLVRSEAMAPKGFGRSTGVTDPAANATPVGVTPTTLETQNIETTKLETANLEGGRDAEDAQFERF